MRMRRIVSGISGEVSEDIVMRGGVTKIARIVSSTPGVYRKWLFFKESYYFARVLFHWEGVGGWGEDVLGILLR